MTREIEQARNEWQRRRKIANKAAAAADRGEIPWSTAEAAVADLAKARRALSEAIARGGE